MCCRIRPAPALRPAQWSFHESPMKQSLIRTLQTKSFASFSPNSRCACYVPPFQCCSSYHRGTLRLFHQWPHSWMDRNRAKCHSQFFRHSIWASFVCPWTWSGDWNLLRFLLLNIDGRCCAKRLKIATNITSPSDTQNSQTAMRIIVQCLFCSNLLTFSVLVDVPSTCFPINYNFQLIKIKLEWIELLWWCNIVDAAAAMNIE